MWSEYDEDISKNEFYREIKENHSDILCKSSEANWIICVPRNGTLKESDRHINTILDHVLVQKGEEKYCTLSKKSLEIKNRKIYLEVDQIYNSNVEILFEETFYTEKAQKYTVWCIDKPLFLKQVICDDHTLTNLENIQACVDFLWVESSGHEILENIQRLCDDFTSNRTQLEEESLQGLKEEIGNLYSQCLQISFKNVILKEKSGKNPIFLENLKISVENYMQFCIGKKLMYSINTIEHFSDEIFNKIVRNARNLNFQDLCIPNHLCDIITLAKYQLGKINSCFTILDKLYCLKQTFHTFCSNSESFYITSDDTLQILVFLILKLNICNWISNLTFLKEFRLSTSDFSDQSSFFVATLEAAIEFIKSNKFLETSSKEFCQNNNDDFTEMYNRINNAECDLVFESENVNLCHPLCACEKCKMLSITNTEILNDKGQNLLIYGTLKNNVRLVELLLSKNFDINFTDFSGKTALHYAAAAGLQDILLLLVAYKANVNVSDNEKNTPLHLACDSGQENCVKALIYSCPELELNLGNFQNETPIFLATKWGFYEIIKILLENGASLCIKNNRNQCVYNFATNYHILKLFKDFGMENSNNFIQESKIKPPIIVDEKKTIPQNAPCKMHHGIRPKSIDQFKKIELLLKAIENNDFPLTCFYLGFNNNLNLHQEISSNCHPLCACPNCQNDYNQVENYHDNFSRSTKVINMCDQNGYTPLHVAAKFGRTEILRTLLDCGALVNISTYKNLESPLHLAVKFQRINVARELLKSGNCDVDIEDVEGNTPLYYACLKNDLKMVELLLTNGADCKRTNHENVTVLQEVQGRNMFRVIKLLRNSIGHIKEEKNFDIFL